MNFKIYNLLNPISQENYNDIYNLFENSFPENERRSRKNQEKLINNNYYNILTAIDEKNELLGFMFFWNFNDFIYVEHFAINTEKRNMGLGGKFLDYLKQNYNNIILEVEHPLEEMSIRRIGFYERCGFFINEYDYIQPAMQKGLKPLPLKIMSYPAKINNEFYKKVEKLLHNVVYNIEF
ncbi:MAG: GNAT family N-acetyltransferase [Oscillospiraceae bacterium]